MADPMSPDSPQTTASSGPLTTEEYRYSRRIRIGYGSLTAALQGDQDHYLRYAQSLLQQAEQAEQEGLDPARIYRAAIAIDTPITRRIHSWEQVKPTPL